MAKIISSMDKYHSRLGRNKPAISKQEQDIIRNTKKSHEYTKYPYQNAKSIIHEISNISENLDNRKRSGSVKKVWALKGFSDKMGHMEGNFMAHLNLLEYFLKKKEPALYIRNCCVILIKIITNAEKNSRDGQNGKQPKKKNQSV